MADLYQVTEAVLERPGELNKCCTRVDSPAPLVLPYTAAGRRARAVEALWTEESPSMQIIEMDRTVTLAEQLADTGEPVILINTFTVAPEDVEQFLTTWADDAAYFKGQPGFISTQLHRGIAGSCVFLNYAVWESTEHFRRAFTNQEFRAKLGQYPSSAVGSPHLFRKVAVPGICVAC